MAQKIIIEGARIGFRNFSGEATKYNAEGNRNFCVFLEPDLARNLHDDGWNVRYLNPRSPEEEPQAYLQVKVSYEYVPPKVFMISKKGKTLLDENKIGMLDWAEIANVDLIIRPYEWEVSGRRGIKAYLNSMYVTIIEDEFALKYADLDERVEELLF